MVDFVKILIQNPNLEALWESLDFSTDRDEKTGKRISNKTVAKFHYCKVEVDTRGSVIFSGSIHILWNSINKVKAPNYNPNKSYFGFNGNDFPLTEIIKTIDYLCRKLKCLPKQMILQKAEFGLNNKVNFNPKLFVKNLLYHNGLIFEHYHEHNYGIVKHQLFWLKIYNKSNQYGMADHTLRTELKVVKTRELKRLGITTFADINFQTLNKASELLLQRFDEVVYYDYTINLDIFNESQKSRLYQYQNKHYWIDELTKQNRRHHKNRIQNIIQNNSENIHAEVRAKIVENSKQLNPNIQTSKSKNTLPITQMCNSKNTLPITQNTHAPKKTNTLLNTTYNSVVFSKISTTPNRPFVAAPKQTIKPSKNDDPKTSTIPPQKKEVKNPKKETPKSEVFCRVTGLDISMQRAGSILLSHTGLKYHHSTNKKEFDKVLNKYLSKRWVHANFDKQIKEIAHNIRNKYTGCKTRNNNNYLENNLFRIAN